MNDETFLRVSRLFGRILKTVCPTANTNTEIESNDYFITFITPDLIQEFEGEDADSVIELAADFIESVLMDPSILEKESVNVAQ